MSASSEMDSIRTKCLQLSDIYYRTTQKLNGQKVPAQEYDIWNGLMFRVLAHSLSILSLSKGTEVKEALFINHFIDTSSIMVLSRSTIETYATFYYLFLDPQSVGDEQIFRVQYSLYRGLLIRQKTVDPQYETQRADEKIRLENNLAKIKLTSTYALLKQGEKNRLEKGRYEHVSKIQMIINSGFPEIAAKQLYSLLSDYAHGGYISSMQISQATTTDNQEISIEMAFYFLVIVLGLMTANIAKKFPNINFEYTVEEQLLLKSITNISDTSS